MKFSNSHHQNGKFLKHELEALKTCQKMAKNRDKGTSFFSFLLKMAKKASFFKT